MSKSGLEKGPEAQSLTLILIFKNYLEREMATYSSILAWRIPWTEETGRWAAVHGVANSWTQLSTHAENAHISLIRTAV